MKPTKPGFYWFKDYDEWIIVQVLLDGNKLEVNLK